MIENAQERIIIHVPIDIVSHKSITEYPIILCENILDAYFYIKITKAFLKQKKMSLNIQSDPQGGGGNTIKDEYNEIQLSNNRLCLCIVDTDQKYQGGPYENTARQLEDIHKKNFDSHHDIDPLVFSKILIIEVREMENLIPCLMFEKCISGNQQRRKFYQLLQKVEKINPLFRFYIDIKKGIILKEIFQEKDPLLIKFWAENLKLLFDKKPCFDDKKCNDNHCDACINILGFGKNITKNVNDILDEISEEDIYKMVNSNIQLSEKWDIIINSIFNWCCCLPPQREI